MSKSQRRVIREKLTKGNPITDREADLLEVLADIIEATPSGQRTARMSVLLSEVRAAQTTL